MHAGCLQRRADHAVEPGPAGVRGIVQHDLLERAVDQQLLLHARLVRARQLRHGDEQGVRAVRARQPLERGLHHLDRAEGVEIDHIGAQIAQHAHRTADGVRNVAELQIEKDLVAPVLQRADHRRPGGVEQLHADLHEGTLRPKLLQKPQRSGSAREIAGDDDVFTHDEHLR